VKNIETGVFTKYQCLSILLSPTIMVFSSLISLSPGACSDRIVRLIGTGTEAMLY